MTQQATTQKPKQDYARKVRALLAKAQHPNTPQAEAEAAMAMASELMTRHRIDKMQLREDKGLAPEEVIAEAIDITKGHGEILANAVYPLILSMGADAVLVGNVFTVVATPSLLENIWALFAVMNLHMISTANTAGDEHQAMLHKRHPRWSDERIADIADQYVWDFCIGYGKGLADKIKNRRKAVIDEAPKNALVLQTEEDRIKAKFRDMYPRLSKGKKLTVRNFDAVEKGYAAGQAADIGDARVTGDTTRALAG